MTEWGKAALTTKENERTPDTSWLAFIKEEIAHRLALGAHFRLRHKNACPLAASKSEAASIKHIVDAVSGTVSCQGKPDHQTALRVGGVRINVAVVRDSSLVPDRIPRRNVCLNATCVGLATGGECCVSRTYSWRGIRKQESE